jgi:ElaB/YqjD/DUF883 family membrane-anchored ribosome-binding protein
MSQTDAANGVSTAEPSSGDGTAELQELQADIEETRDELAATVAALAAKTDVKARAQEKLSRIRMRSQDRARESAAAIRERGREIAGIGASFTRQGVVLAATVAAAAVVGWVLIRRRRG